jgi:membrane protein DedA with SNARE-associated domain
LESFLPYLVELAHGAPYLVLLVVLVLCGIGLPLPEDVPMILAGILIAQDEMSWAGALGVSILGVLAGDSLVYLGGRRLGVAALRSPLIEKKLGKRRIRRFRALYRLRGERVVFFARFVMLVRVVAFFLAGALGIKYRRFVLLDGAAALLSVPIWIALGHWLGRTYGDDIQRVLDATAPARNVIGLVIAVAAVIVVVRWVRLLGKARAQAAAVTTPAAEPASEARRTGS